MKYLGDIQKGWIKAIIILPFNVIVVFPALILYFLKYKFIMPNAYIAIISILLFLLGFALALWTMWLFNDIGRGTAAPWQPPQNLVIAGPYKIVRNPMISSVLIMLTAESLFLSSWAIFIYAIIFFFMNCIHFCYFEEKWLERKFGAAYLEYKKNVPRWLPKLKK